MRQLANITIEIKGCIIAISWHLLSYVRAISCYDMSNFVGISPSFLTILKFDDLLNILLSKH